MDKQEFRNENGLLHNENGPAIIDPDGKQTWWKNGRIHRDGGPAIINANGVQSWYKDGNLHRLDGPAYIKPDGNEMWYKEGMLHRVDGPAIMMYGKIDWYVDGTQFTSIIEYLRETGMRRADIIDIYIKNDIL